MKIVDISAEIYNEMGNPTSTSIAAIAYYLRGQVGTINNLLFEDFYIESSSGQYEIWDGGGKEISIDAAAIIKQLYRIYDYNIRIRSNFDSLSESSILEVSDDGSSIKRTNRNEIAKSLGTLKSSEEKMLKDLVTAYRMKLAIPQSVAGDDNQQGFFGQITTSDLRTFLT